MLAGVLRVDRVHVIPGDVIDHAAGGKLLRQPDLERVHAGDVMDHDADLAGVVRHRRLPLGIAEAFREGDQRGGSLFEHHGEGFGARACGGARGFQIGEHFRTRIHDRLPSQSVDWWTFLRGIGCGHAAQRFMPRV